MQGQTTSDPMGIEEIESKGMEAIAQARGVVEEFAKDNPRAALGIAVGIGFVLGGGITPRLLFGIGAIAARRYARDFAKAQLGSVTRGFFNTSQDDRAAVKPRVKSSRPASTSE